LEEKETWNLKEKQIAVCEKERELDNTGDSGEWEECTSHEEWTIEKFKEDGFKKQ
jgi:hypothetical protein